MKYILFLAGLLQAAPLWAQEPPASPPSITQGEERRFETVLEGMQDILDGLADAGRPIPDEPVGETMALSLREAVTLALERNPRVAEAEAEVDAANAQVGQARSALFPQVRGTVAFRYQEGADQTFGGGFLTDLIAPGATDVEEITRADRLSAEQVLYSGGQIRAGIEASGYLARSEEWRRIATLDDVEFRTKKAYLDCLLTGALVRVAEDSVIAFERHLRDTRQKLNVGMAAPVEEMRARSELLSRKSDEDESRNGRRIAYANLRRILALPQDTELKLTTRPTWLPLEASPATYVNEALASRPEVLAMKSAVAASKQDIRRVKGQYRPSVAATVEWTNLVDAGSFVLDGWTGSVAVQWDLFTGRRRKYEKQEAEARHRSLESQLDRLYLGVEFDVRQAYIRVQNAIGKMSRESANVEVANESLRLTSLRFREGLGTQADLLDAELALTLAETQLVQGTRDFAVAHAELERATGRSWNRVDGAEAAAARYK
jgi:outer membrane protein TolC